MMKKWYDIEDKYINAVNGWRRACHEGGLSKMERSTLNLDFLNYILDNLMPWHKVNHDFSLTEVNKYVLLHEYKHENITIKFCYQH